MLTGHHKVDLDRDFSRESDRNSTKTKMKPPSRTRCGLVYLLFILSLALAPSIAKKARIDGPIKVVVVMVMENRSFDHMLGWLKTLNPEIDGLTGKECNPKNTSNPDSELVCVSNIAEFVDPDPGHSFQAIREQIFGKNETSAIPPPMNGFAQQAESMAKGFSKTVMSGFRPEVVPAYKALAAEYAVFDRWFASAPTSTQPNRFYVHSATSYGAMSNVREELIEGFPQKTIFESIVNAGHTVGIYYQNLPATLFFRNLRKLKFVNKFHDYTLKFRNHARRGVLPNYVVVEQRYFDTKVLPANDDHPSHDVSEGQGFVKEVYEILRASPQWNEMLFIITYDEHGGFYDHVPTPVTNVPNPDGLIGPPPEYFNFRRLGVRVPTLMISPWINKGVVVHGPHGPTADSQYEHSSIPATVRKIFNLPDDFLTARDEWAGTFEHVFAQRKSPRIDCPKQIPSPPWSLRHSPPNESAPLTEFQEELIQLASQLNGDHQHPEYPHLGKRMNVGQAYEYATKAVAKFIETGKAALKAGADPETVIMVSPGVIEMTEDSDNHHESL
nr:non-specific phospholipase C1-like isoform X2 [Physcomitrium patens]|eukprot:XP_024373675.1 non-specific phospholipase C1-like isoform X2 [Physcomitrella patens]